ncbi:MAG TPA: GNAT family N-acetyltransferase, partial [Anaerolineales bacterium]|nr:GNAT family N-acetyltransferase [Anaerolineales bacterium]
MEPSPRFPDFPVLSTSRLILRDLNSSDLDDLYEYASDLEIDQYTPWDRYKSLDEAREDLEGYIARYEQGHFRAWGIEHRADKKLIGITNFG